MNSLKKVTLEYAEDRLKRIKKEAQEMADRISNKPLGMSKLMAQEIKEARANEYCASETNTLIHIVNDKSSDEDVIKELQYRLDFYLERMKQYNKQGGYFESGSDNMAYTERSKGTLRGIERTHGSLKAFMMHMVDKGLLNEVKGTDQEYELVEE